MGQDLEKSSRVDNCQEPQQSKDQTSGLLANKKIVDQFLKSQGSRPLGNLASGSSGDISPEPSKYRGLGSMLDNITSLQTQLTSSPYQPTLSARPQLTFNQQSSSRQVRAKNQTINIQFRHLPYKGDEKQQWRARRYDAENCGVLFVPHRLNSNRRSCRLNPYSMVAWVAGQGETMGEGPYEHARGIWAMWLGEPYMGDAIVIDHLPSGGIKMEGDPNIPNMGEIQLFGEIMAAINTLTFLRQEIHQPVRLFEPNLIRNRKHVNIHNRTDQVVIISSSFKLVSLITGDLSIGLLEQVEKSFWALNRVVEKLESEGINVEFHLVHEILNGPAFYLARKARIEADSRAEVAATL